MVGIATTLNPIILTVLKCGPKIGLAGTSSIVFQILRDYITFSLLELNYIHAFIFG